jgi:hypothetical protein
VIHDFDAHGVGFRPESQIYRVTCAGGRIGVFDGIGRGLADRENEVVPSLLGESELPEELAGFSANGR